jgi:hypothetical protein
MSPGEWIALGALETPLLVWLMTLSYKVGIRERDNQAMKESLAQREREIVKAQKDNDGIARKVRGVLGLMADWSDLDEKERRHRAIEMLEGK